MDFRIASAMSKIRVIPRQAVNLNVNPNEGNIAQRSEKAVKGQIARAKHNLRKAFAQKPDEYIHAEAAEEKVVPARVKQLAKLPKHKRVQKVAVPKKHKTPKVKIPFENETQEILSPIMTKEEEQQWINLALRNHDYFWDYKPLDRHYMSEIALGDWNQYLVDEKATEGYKKAFEAKTKAHFDDIKADEEYKKNLCWKDLIAQNNKGTIIIEQNNKLRIIMR